MKKTILIGSLLVFFVLGMNSCKKCYVCTQTVIENRNSVTDSAINLRTEVCSGKNGVGANLNVTIQDIESNGYICVSK